MSQIPDKNRQHDGGRGSYPISAEDIETYRTQGALCLRKVFEPAEIEAIRAEVDAAMARPGPYAIDFSAEGGNRFFGDVFVWTRVPALRDLVVFSRLGEIAGRLMQSRQVQFFFDHLLVKEPGSAEPTPWHQDSPYFPIEGGDCCSIWIALDPVTIENGAVEYALGTHASGKQYAPKSFTKARELENRTLEEMPDVEARRDEFAIVHWDLQPGDCAVHHVRTIHGAPGNLSAATRRRGLATRWIGDDIVFGMRPGIPEPMLNTLADLAPDLQLGHPFDHPLFPVVWRHPDSQ